VNSLIKLLQGIFYKEYSKNCHLWHAGSFWSSSFLVVSEMYWKKRELSEKKRREKVRKLEAPNF
jgi:hypothetical protein